MFDGVKNIACGATEWGTLQYGTSKLIRSKRITRLAQEQGEALLAQEIEAEDMVSAAAANTTATSTAATAAAAAAHDYPP